MNMNKVNMSLDEIINNSRRNKKDLGVVKGREGNSHFQKNHRDGFRRRGKFNIRNF